MSGSQGIGDGAEPDRAVSDEELFTQLYPSLRRFAAVAKTPEADADDLVQEALVRALALRPLSEYKNPAAYLRRTILNLASNVHRSSGRAGRALHRLAEPSEAPVSYPSDLQDLLQLAPVQRAAVYLAVVEGLSHAAIGETLDCSEAAARNRVSRGLRALRVELNQELRDA
jgi:RNA polymerase sigma factor (sigma-70 family)